MGYFIYQSHEGFVRSRCASESRVLTKGCLSNRAITDMNLHRNERLGHALRCVELPVEPDGNRAKNLVYLRYR